MDRMEQVKHLRTDPGGRHYNCAQSILVPFAGEAGLEEEARRMLPYRSLNALQTVGYREFFDYFDGTVTRDEAITLIKRNSRRYAKRQLTWFRRDAEIRWFSPFDTEGVIAWIDTQSGAGEY